MVAGTRQREISRELDDYIASKRKGGWFGMFSKSEMRDDAHNDTDTPMPEAAPVTLVDEQASSTVDGADEPATQKRGWFSRMFGGGEDVAAASEVDSDVSVHDDDLREIARITLAFLRMTDDAALTRIKSSSDFEKFKDILRRRQIIK